MCVRKHNIRFFTPTNNNPECSSLSADGRCSYDGERPTLSSGQYYSFIQTNFHSCQTTSNGGAIYLNGESQQSSTSLEVSDSTFTQCYAYLGAAIYVETIASLAVSSSFFYKCGNAGTEGGGGIYLVSVTLHTIMATRFVSLHSCEDAGALLFNVFTPPFNAITVKDNQFLFCTVSGRSGSSGGACEIWPNSCPRFSNCLFSQITATFGGALIMNGVYPSPVLSFSFFHDNTGSTAHGHDCCLYDGGTPNLALHCFSDTPRSPRVYPSGHDTDWLPSGTLKDKTPIHPPLNTVLLMHTSDNEWSLILYPFK